MPSPRRHQPQRAGLRRRGGLLALAAVAVSACSGRSVRNVRLPWARGATAEQVVWRTALDSLYVPAGARLVVVAEHSAELPERGSALRWWLRTPSNLDPATFADFRARNAASAPLEARPPLDVRVATADEEQIWALRGGGAPAWRRFFERHEGARGLLELTRVGFRPDSQQAFFVVRHSCGVACGDVAALVLTRGREGAWQVRERHVVERRAETAAGEVERKPPARAGRKAPAAKPRAAKPPAAKPPAAKPPAKAPAKPPVRTRPPER